MLEKPNKLIIMFFFFMTVFISACGLNQPPAQKLIITGSSTIAPLMTEVAKRYESLHKDTRIDVQSGGSSRGIADTRQGLADIGMVSRSPKSNEKDLQWFAIARDGVAIIVNSQNPIETLSDQQVIDIYTGKITQWQKLNDNALPISVVNKAEGRSTLEVFLNYFNLKNSAIKAQVIIGDNQQGIKTVAINPGAIGYVSVGTAEYEVKQGTAIKLLSTNAITASVENIRNGSFPIARTLHLITKLPPTGLAKEFIAFAQSKSVNDLVEAQYFVPLTD